jgi:MFS family permease
MIGKSSTGGRAVFRHVDYTRFLFSRFLWGLGLQIQTIAIAWYVYDVTNDPLSLGLIGLAAFIPAVPLSLLTGPAADRYDRRIIMLICCTIMALCSAARADSSARAQAAYPTLLSISLPEYPMAYFSTRRTVYGPDIPRSRI